jgi:cytochrome c oxidase subunit 3
MWLFLATEVLFFGGLLVAYSVYRANHPEIFVYAHQFLDKNLGAVNTVILICSSFTMAWAVRAAQLRQKGMLTLMLVLTLVFASGFLGVKYVEYSHKWHHGLLWASRYDPHHGHEQEHSGDEAQTPAAEAVPVAPAPGTGHDEVSKMAPAAIGPAGLAAEEQPDDSHGDMVEPENAKFFFSIYFMMTGLHGVHVLGGMAAMLWLLVKTRRGDFATGHFTPVDMVGLYWHLVDLIWIYLFLLLYLIH